MLQYLHHAQQHLGFLLKHQEPPDLLNLLQTTAAWAQHMLELTQRDVNILEETKSRALLVRGMSFLKCTWK